MSGIRQMQIGCNATFRQIVNLTISANTQDYNLYSNRGAGYVAGKTDFVVTINSGIIVGSSSTASYAFTTSGLTAGDTLEIINNGYICGMGGKGGGYPNFFLFTIPSELLPGPGGPALFLTIPTKITNANGYIYSGGGGGGAYYFWSSMAGANWCDVGAGGGAGNNIGAGGVIYNNSPSWRGYDGALTAGGHQGLARVYGGAYGGMGGALGIAGGNAITGGGGGGGGGANGGNATTSGAGHGVAIQGVGYVTWISGNTRVYGGTA